MCGIFGYLARNGNKLSFSYRNLWNNLFRTNGRGPDNMQLDRVSEQMVLGFNRLRINDVSENGDQPLKMGNVSVIANAEIYNYEALKAKYGFEFNSGSDCEIFLHLYNKFGNVEDFI